MDFFTIDAHWLWWTFALLLLAMQVFVADDFFLALSITAGIMGGMVLVLPNLAFPMQILIFVGLAIASFFIARPLFQKLASKSDHPNLNNPGARYIGRTLVLKEAIVNGCGHEYLEGTPWTLHGPDCDVGTQVEVVSLDGIALKVRRVESE